MCMTPSRPRLQGDLPTTHPASHASLARAFLAEYCDDADLLATVQYHDEPYAIWRSYTFKGKNDAARFATLLATIRNWNLFLAFCLIDGCAQGKTRGPLQWLFHQVDGKVESSFTAMDIS